MAPKILVTGADGFIGSHLTESLVRAGFEVRAFVMYNSLGSWGWLDECAPDVKGNFEVFAGDVRDPYGVRSSMRNCDTVAHLAALIAIPYSYYSPETYVDTNIKGTLNILQSAQDLGLSKVIHTSTSEVYGTARFAPITEDHPLQSQSPYSATKIGADQIAISFINSFKTPISIIRPFNTYGPRQSARAVIPTIISQIANGARTIRLGALSPSRDFNFVDDTVAGFMAAISSPAAIGQVINLGGSFEVSIGDTAKIISDLMGIQVSCEPDPKRLRPATSEVERLWASNQKANDLLGWAPKYSGLEGFKRGLNKTIDWFKDPKNLAMYKSSLYNI